MVWAGVATGRPSRLAQPHGVLDELEVGGVAVADVVLEADAEVAALLDGGPGDRGGEEVAADHGREPRQRAVVEGEQLAVGGEAGEGGRQAEGDAGAAGEHAVVAPEVELHERPGREAPGPPVGEHVAQPARLEAGEVQAHAPGGALVDGVAHGVVVERVEVAVGLGRAVGAGRPEDGGAGVDEGQAQGAGVVRAPTGGRTAPRGCRRSRWSAGRARRGRARATGRSSSRYCRVASAADRIRSGRWQCTIEAPASMHARPCSTTSAGGAAGGRVAVGSRGERHLDDDRCLRGPHGPPPGREAPIIPDRAAAGPGGANSPAGRSHDRRPARGRGDRIGTLRSWSAPRAPRAPWSSTPTAASARRASSCWRRVGARVEFVPSYVWLVDHPDDAERTGSMVLLVAPDGSVAEAEHAVAGALLLSRRPATWLGALIEVPGLHLFAKHAYRLVAANRARISAALGLDACAIADRPT